jgi:hypothetical protein
MTSTAGIPERDAAGLTVVRWAIGAADEPRSSTWRLWGNKKGDIYAAVRSLGGITKASFHRDGRCQVGFTEGYAATASRRFGAAASRHWERWQLPPDPIVRILQLIVPSSELRPFVDANPHRRGMIWLPAPPEGSVGVVSVFVCVRDLTLPLPADPGDAMVFGRVRASARTAWVVYARHPPDAVLAEIITMERARLKSIPGADHVPSGTRASLWESRADHDRHVLELACD